MNVAMTQGLVTITEPPGAVELTCDGSSDAPELEREIARRFAMAFEIWKQRQRKYGPGNIARRGPVGVFVRMEDKLERIAGVILEGKADDQADETVRDTMLDVANYAVILLACYEGVWPGWEVKRS
jgi:hypothetical protein